VRAIRAAVDKPHRRLLLEMSLLMLVPTAALAQEMAIGRVTLDNRSASAADLYIDGELACGAPAHGQCTAEVATGVHVATIQFTDGDQIPGGMFDLAADVPVVLPVVDLTT
jgi:hypothetical protein